MYLLIYVRSRAPLLIALSNKRGFSFSVTPIAAISALTVHAGFTPSGHIAHNVHSANQTNGNNGEVGAHGHAPMPGFVSAEAG